METLSLFIEDKEFNQIIYPHQKEIIVRVCLPMLKTTQSELDMVTKDPEQFV